jgi:hypothetical protein
VKKAPKRDGGDVLSFHASEAMFDQRDVARPLICDPRPLSEGMDIGGVAYNLNGN